MNSPIPINIPWQIKVLALLSGIIYTPLAIILMLIDGWFHLSSNLETLKEESPDWIIARNIFKTNAFSENIHKFIGAALIIGVIWYMSGNMTPTLKTFYVTKFIPFTMILIASGITIKGLIK